MLQVPQADDVLVQVVSVACPCRVHGKGEKGCWARVVGGDVQGMSRELWRHRLADWVGTTQGWHVGIESLKLQWCVGRIVARQQGAMRWCAG